MMNPVMHLKKGGIIAYPTETIWGFGVDIHQDSAVRRLFAIKRRPLDSPISILVSGINMAKRYATVSPNVERLMEVVWPGPVTFVLPCQASVSPLIHAGSDFVGLRYTPLRWLNEIIQNLGQPITTTSANRSGEAPALTSSDLTWVPEDVMVIEGENSTNTGESVEIWEPFKSGESDESRQPSQKGSTIIRISNNSLELLRRGDFDPETLLRMAHSFSL